MLNHYTNNYVNFQGFGDASVTIFFLLSGYGIFYSLEKDGRIIPFFIKRITRIYPAYWLVLAISSLYLHKIYSLKVLLAIPFISRAPDHLWFIPAIIECYIFAPLIFFILKGFNKWIYISLFVSLLVFAQIVNYVHYPDFNLFVYRNFLFSNIFLFAIGMVLPSFKVDIKKGLYIFTIFFIYLIMAKVSLIKDACPTISSSLISIAFYVSTFMFCLFTLSYDGKLPLGNTIGKLGKYSYPLYLFHPTLYILVFLVCKEYNYKHVIITVILFPLFYMFCRAIDFGLGDERSPFHWLRFYSILNRIRSKSSGHGDTDR